MVQNVETPETLSVASGATDRFTTVWTFERAADVSVSVEIAGVITEQVPGVDYDVEAGDWLNDGADIVFRPGKRPPAGSRVIRERITAAAQAEPLGDLESFRPHLNEQAFDRLTRMLQEERARGARAVTAPYGEAAPRLSPVALRQDRLAAFDAAGDLVGTERTLTEIDEAVRQVADRALDTLENVDPATGRASLALAGMAVQDPAAVSVSGGVIGGGAEIRASTTALGSLVDFFSSAGWRANHRLETQATTQHVGDARATAIISRTHAGSGARGPQHADHALFIKVKKTDFSDGEHDGVYGLMDHIGGGDVAFLLGHVEKTGTDGGGVGAELAVMRFTELTDGVTGAKSKGPMTNRVHLYAPHAKAGDGMEGLVLETKMGVSKTAILIDTYDERPSGSAAAAPAWEAGLRLVRNRSTEIYLLDGEGRVHHGVPGDKIITRYDTNSHILQQLGSDGGAGLTALDQAGNFSVAAQVQGAILRSGWYVMATVPSAAARQGAIIGIADGAAGAKCTAMSDGGSWLYSAPLSYVVSAS